MTAEPIPAQAETTIVIPRVEAPLPPYARPSADNPPPAMSPYAPAPPPAPVSRPADAPSQTMADAMIAISMPPLASSTPDLPVAVEPTAAPAAERAVGEPTTLVPTAVEPALVAPAAPAPLPTTATAVVMPPPASDLITCPECGTTAQVTLNRRDSVDFCRTCDYPLFWTPTNVIRDPSGRTDESLRRLPGQAGRATIASLPCPFCHEPNALSAQTCIRCQRPMHPVEELPPAPVYVAPAPVYVPPPPEPKVAWWVWALLGLGAAALIVLVVLMATHTIG